ncbi:biosynthetic-type acetolactate synthase large subunit [Enterococcus dongliensis]|uniref:Acetolactate synthase n=1 Tax=Enterococcus dongliensis TaxID=2559925 RepID=A0AAP5NMI7_9ENTE|nr:biosynthetic-type acetolactate synthase large subunit [Enterococcus dongliensis]MDT2595824.1 biosynthetic-type acetolactate synthase large subunit [Enterococcus dongliensis]MDT2602915.1 biosynthetic-type acetolactate synthase large subunit [Enterococcus dongliensis]MDT2614005.1 biosynthetic-type acetolactate synthase large subunit [Enterococcus dongliensis]MDT2633891.1 biosynthetic-type acetolactate synthase large subunit [Enterococcus dongliensis]MDT2638208.1 biosynthetic-type acetolactate
MEEMKQKVAVEDLQTGADLLIKCLENQGVELIFGYPGGAVLPLYDSLYDETIPNILTRHEQGAVHAAEGYAKATGKPGVVIVTSGPGATNVVTGIADAMIDSVPLVVISGQVSRAGIGKDAFQEADILGITVPITKNNYQVRDIEELPRIVNEAFHIATTGRKGPVLIDLPKDITTLKANPKIDDAVHLESYQPTTIPSALQIERLMNLLKQAKKPIVLAGAGVVAADGEEELRQFVEKYQLPTVSTLLGLGLLPHDHPNFLGMGGMHGTYAANMALMETDLLINIGSRFDDRLACSPKDFAPHAKVAHIDIDPVEIGKIIPTDIPIVGDAKIALQQMLSIEIDAPDCQPWRELCEERKQKYPLKYERDEKIIKPQEVVEIIGRITKGDSYIVTDVGQHQMWAAQYYPFKFSKQLITSGGLGTMGYGIPAGVGVKFGQPDKSVVVFVGDGGFEMTNQEFAILNQNNLDIKFVLMNNQSLGMVRQWQEKFFNERRSQSVFNEQPDFMKMAEAYGIGGRKITDPATLDEELQEAFATPGPMLIEVMISKSEHVLPMIPAGMPNDQMLGVD